MALVALLLGGINRTMSWYKIPILAIGLYTPIALIFTQLITILFDKLLKKFKVCLAKNKENNYFKMNVAAQYTFS